MKRTALLWFGLVLAVLAGALDRFDQWVMDTEIPILVREQSVEVHARDGSLLRAFTVADGRWRLGVDAESVDRRYLEMLIAYEDQRFYSHSGVDWVAVARAAGQALLAGEVISGASTLTMQVARLLEDGSTGALSGKLRQARLALALERRLSKEQILSIYLHRAPMGGNLEGIRSATFAYFGKEPHRLTPAEAALLVALPQSPERRRPDRAPETARAARDRVLERMVTNGVLSGEEALAARIDPVPHARRPFPSLAPHLGDALRAAAPLQTVHTTTIDRRLQKRAEELARSAAQSGGERLSAALLLVDHRTGDTLARVGSAGYLDEARGGGVDMSRAVRSPGSTLKPLAYGLAFDAGLAHPESLVDDRPMDFGGYRPTNFDGQFRGTLRIREALALSLNLPAVQLTEGVGPVRLLSRIRRSGAKPELPIGTPGLAVVLGGLGMTLEDLARLYGSIARGGEPLPLSTLAGEPEPGGAAPVLSSVPAWYVADILSEIPPPTGRPDRPLAYKTGTSYGHRDAWAVGFDGRHVAAVWLGRPDGTAVPGIFGADLAAPLLYDLMAQIEGPGEPLPPPPAAALTVNTSALPQPLRTVGGTDSANGSRPEPRIAFPPDGAEVAAADLLALKVREGAAPFTWLADGRPVVIGSHLRDTYLDAPGVGPLTLSVIDAHGHADRVRVTILE